MKKMMIVLAGAAALFAFRPRAVDMAPGNVDTIALNIGDSAQLDTGMLWMSSNMGIAVIGSTQTTMYVKGVGSGNALLASSVQWPRVYSVAKYVKVQ